MRKKGGKKRGNGLASIRVRSRFAANESFFLHGQTWPRFLVFFTIGVKLPVYHQLGGGSEFQMRVYKYSRVYVAPDRFRQRNTAWLLFVVTYCFSLLLDPLSYVFSTGAEMFEKISYTFRGNEHTRVSYYFIQDAVLRRPEILSEVSPGLVPSRLRFLQLSSTCFSIPFSHRFESPSELRITDGCCWKKSICLPFKITFLLVFE